MIDEHSISKNEGRALSLGYRIYRDEWLTGEQFKCLLVFLKDNMARTDDIWLFDEFFPKEAYISISQMSDLCQILKNRIEVLRENGFTNVGLNIINTLGHESLYDCEDPLPFPTMVDFDGSISESCACPNSSEFRLYIRKKYALAAGVNPDFIWVDDDFRMSSIGVRYACFCPSCVSRFGLTESRQELVSLLNQNENQEIRMNWNDYIVNSLKTLAESIREAVNQVNDSIEIGYMPIGYSHTTYARDDFKYMKAFNAKRVRPGHGFYTDEQPLTILNKIMDVGRLNQEFPAEVKNIQYEMETYPYVHLDKSARTVINEATLGLIVGCTGTAFNIIRMDAGSLAGYDKYTKAINRNRLLWNEIINLTEGMSYPGVWPVSSTKLMARRDVDEHGWFHEGGDYDINTPNQLMTAGIPFTPSRKTAVVAVLSGKIAEAIDESDLHQLLSNGVYMDNAALEVLWNKGLGELTGVKPGEIILKAQAERFTAHPLNGVYKEDGRHVGPVNKQAICPLLPLNENAEELAYLVDFNNRNYGCCFSVYTNKLGGRIAVSSFDAWQHLGTAAKRTQILSVMDWLSGNRLPVVIDSMIRVAPFVRMNEQRTKILIALFNISFDDTGEITIKIRAEASRMWQLLSEGRKEIELQHVDGEIILQVPDIRGWHTVLLYGE